MSQLTQDTRNIGVDTLLGKDELLLLSIHGEEAISEQFCYTLNVAAERRDISPKELIGQRVNFWIKGDDGEKQFFNAYVSHLKGGALVENGFRSYQMQLVPWSWFLGKNQNFKIFQNKSAPEIIESIFTDFKFSDFQNVCEKEYPKLDYCVQYQESSLHFISRLMQQFGLFYFFTHEENKHNLVLADKATAYINLTSAEIVQTFGGEQAKFISRWDNESEFITSQWSQSDFNFESPSRNLQSSANTIIDQPSPDQYEAFGYPGGYGDSETGSRLTDLRMMEEESSYLTVQADSNYQHFFAGGKFTLKAHDFEHEVGQSYAISSLTFDITENSYFKNQSAFTYQNSFVAIPADIVCYSKNKMRKQKVFGPHTAIVVGPEGEKIYTDEYARVKVQFHWDREGEKNESSSCWVRVSQDWAGKGWGSVSMPHVGNEVIVSFLNGDPDRPIITGRVYNAEQMPPQDLPDNKHKNILQDDYGNEIVLDATPGDEHIRIYSPSHDSLVDIGKSIKTNTESDSTSFTTGSNAEAVLGNKASLAIGNYGTANIGTKATANIGAAASFDLGMQYSVALTGKYAYTAGFSRTWTHGTHHTASTSDVLSQADGNNIIASNKDICIAATSATNPSVGLVSATNTKLSMGMGKAVKPKGAATFNWHVPADSVSQNAALAAEIAANVIIVTAAVLSIVACTKRSRNDNHAWIIGFNIAAGVLAAVSAAMALAKVVFDKTNKSKFEALEHVNPELYFELDEMKGISLSSIAIDKPIEISHGTPGNEFGLTLDGKMVALGEKTDKSSFAIDRATNNIFIENDKSGTGEIVLTSGKDIWLDALGQINFNSVTCDINKNFTVLK